MSVRLSEYDLSKPVCGCCAGTGGHGYHVVVGSVSPYDDDEDCTNCGGKGRTFHTDAKPRSCLGYRALMRRVNRI